MENANWLGDEEALPAVALPGAIDAPGSEAMYGKTELKAIKQTLTEGNPPAIYELAISCHFPGKRLVLTKKIHKISKICTIFTICMLCKTFRTCKICGVHAP